MLSSSGDPQLLFDVITRSSVPLSAAITRRLEPLLLMWQLNKVYHSGQTFPRPGRGSWNPLPNFPLDSRLCAGMTWKIIMSSFNSLFNNMSSRGDAGDVVIYPFKRRLPRPAAWGVRPRDDRQMRWRLPRPAAWGVRPRNDGKDACKGHRKCFSMT